MLHLFMGKGPWFRAKKYGYGSGLPFKWQGWVFLALHVALVVGVSLAFADRLVIALPLVAIAALAPMPIYAARTEGGWKWRDGR